MINLLPPEEKTKLLLENRKKMIIVLGITIIIPLFCLILVLLSVRFYILGEVNSKKIMLDQARKEYQTPDFLHFKEIIQKNNHTLTNLHSFYQKEVSVSQALYLVSSISRPENLYFTNMLLAKDSEQKIKITASGFSKSRADLLLFQKSINENSRIKNTTFSPESWVSPKDINFNVTFEYVSI